MRRNDVLAVVKEGKSFREALKTLEKAEREAIREAKTSKELKNLVNNYRRDRDENYLEYDELCPRMGSKTSEEFLDIWESLDKLIEISCEKLDKAKEREAL